MAIPGGNALDLAYSARYRHPDAGVIFGTGTEAFSGGSVFSLCRYAPSFVHSDAAFEDLAAIIEGHAAVR